MLQGKRVLIFGFAGSIGEELTRQLASNNPVYGIDIDETRMFDLAEELKIQGRVGNIEDYKTVEDAFYWAKPDIVFQVAAKKHVTPSEENPIEAVRTNIIGTHNIIECCKKYDKQLINISTDKVVNGESIMGLTKKIAEKMVKNAGGVSVRFGNVMGSRGSVLSIWQKQMNEGRPLTITDPNMERYMMTIPEAVSLVLKAAEIGKPGQVLVMDMGIKVNILQLAKQILQKANKEEKIEIIGKRKGEMLTEEIMTSEEKDHAVKIENFWVL